MHDLPGPLHDTSPFPFVGRSAELERLRTLMPRADGEGRRVVLLGGEAGLRQEPARARVRRRGGGGRRSRPLRRLRRRRAHALRAVRRGARPARAGARAGRAARGARLRGRRADAAAARPRRAGRRPPRGGQRRPRHRAPPAAHRRRRPARRRHRARGPRCSCSRTGTGPTRRRSCSCATWRAPAEQRVLLLATFRDTEADVPEALAETLADLRRYDVVRLRLAGLSDGDVAEFVRRAGGGELGAEPRALARAIRELTEGNAFLVCELWRALVETGAVELADGTIRVTRSPAELGSPESVREVVSRRLARLAPRTSDLLELAATAGTEFELDVVRRAAGLGEPELLAALDEAVAQRHDRRGPAHGLACRFTHELVRRALYDRLSGPRRAELHLRVGEALEAGGARSGRALADLAHHFAAAAPFGPRRARRRVQPARGAGGRRGARLRRGGRAAAHRARARHRRPGERAGVPRARRGEPPRRQGARRARGVHGGRGHRPRARRRAAAGARGDRLRGGVLAARHGRPRRRRAAGGGRRRARRATTPSCASGCSAGSPARCDLQGHRERGAVVARRAPSRWPAGWTTAPGSPPS